MAVFPFKLVCEIAAPPSSKLIALLLGLKI